jgi:hypothetical protein
VTSGVTPDGGRSLQGGWPQSSVDDVRDHGVVPDSSSVPSPRSRGDDGAGVLPQPRAARDDEPAPAEPPRLEAASTQRVYADGSALSRYLDGAPCRAQWLAWAADHEAQLLTTPLGLTELRRVARPRGVEASGVAHDVEERVEVIRFSDQTLRAATKVSGVLPPFIALHIGAALAHPEVGSVATYDVQLAQVSALHGLAVVSPGWPAQWWERAG